MRKNERFNLNGRICRKIFLPIDEHTVIHHRDPLHPTFSHSLCYRDDIHSVMIDGVRLQEGISATVNEALRNDPT